MKLALRQQREAEAAAATNAATAAEEAVEAAEEAAEAPFQERLALFRTARF